MTIVPSFSVTDPADDLALLSAEECRVAAGLARDDAGRDEALAEYQAEVAAEIVADCAIASDGVNPPTLRAETCVDVFRLGCGSVDVLDLSRRHVTAITSIEEAGEALTADDWLLDAERGRLVRLVNDAESCWTAAKVEVTYVAGFAVVPQDLKAEAKARLAVKVSEGSRDPLARTIRTEIPDLETREIGYQIGGLSRLTGNGLSAESERRLKRFMMHSMVG